MSDTAVQTTDREAVLCILTGIYDAWAGNDADAFVADYDPDASSVLPGEVTSGRDAVRARMAARFDGPLKGSKVLSNPQQVRFPIPDTAILISRDAIVMAGESEPPADRWVMSTWTMVRRDGRWLVAAFHTCPA